MDHFIVPGLGCEISFVFSSEGKPCDFMGYALVIAYKLNPNLLPTS
jgi:hypothetical protein